MKLLLFLFFALIIVSCSHKSIISDDNRDILEGEDNSMTSLDYPGTYYGTLPCADCDSLQTLIKLNDNLTYEIQRKYLGKDEKIFSSKGKFKWDKAGRRIWLMEDNNPDTLIYLVGENTITQLDLAGKPITGGLADKYILRKTPQDITDKYWRLIELGGKPIDIKNPTTEPHIYLNSADNSLEGSGGCNTFSATFELIAGSRIKISGIISTKMRCEDIEIEKEFFNVLESADNYQLSPDMLILNKAKMAPLAKFEAVYMR